MSHKRNQKIFLVKDAFSASPREEESALKCFWVQEFNRLFSTVTFLNLQINPHSFSFFLQQIGLKTTNRWQNESISTINPEDIVKLLCYYLLKCMREVCVSFFYMNNDLVII